jgi:hypothetical protein
MSRRPLALILLLALSWSAHALDARVGAAAATDSNESAAEQAQKQKRRDVLREALKLPVADVPSAPVRQLSSQEKAELRQQLRQQRLDVSK